MRQVPKKNSYLLVGRGRVATHLSYFFKSKNMEFSQWSRGDSQNFMEALKTHTHVLLAISDPAIVPFFEQHAAVALDRAHANAEATVQSQAESRSPMTWIHFSGRIYDDRILGMHPLMSFGPQLYDIETYNSIPFIVDHPNNQNVSLFKEHFPLLESNPVATIDSTKKNLYHALCALAGSATTLLWEKLFQTFETEFKIPAPLADPFLNSIAHNLLSHGHESQLTGPLKREDTQTLAAHLEALKKDPYEQVYRSLISAYQAERGSP